MYLERVEVKAYKLVGVYGYDVAELFNNSLDDCERESFVDNVGIENLMKTLLTFYTKDELLYLVNSIDYENKNASGDNDE